MFVDLETDPPPEFHSSREESPLLRSDLGSLGQCGPQCDLEPNPPADTWPEDDPHLVEVAERDS